MVSAVDSMKVRILKQEINTEEYFGKVLLCVDDDLYLGFQSGGVVCLLKIRNPKFFDLSIDELEEIADDLETKFYKESRRSEDGIELIACSWHSIDPIIYAYCFVHKKELDIYNLVDDVRHYIKNDIAEIPTNLHQCKYIIILAVCEALLSETCPPLL